MRWQDMERSGNVEDRRGRSGFSGAVRGKPGILTLLLVLVAGYYGIDLSGFLGEGAIPVQQTQQRVETPESRRANDTLADFTKVVLKQTEDVWSSIFQQYGHRYETPRLVLYSGTTETACGYGQAAMGPFYCPADRKLYVDLSFYQDMQTKLGGGGDFALGYVVAHEVGHHVQNLLGTAEQVRSLQARSNKRESNQLSVMMELQADCYAGIWGHHVARAGRLEEGDLEEALRTATAIGDDRLQHHAQGYVVPDSFTHGTSEQRYSWFRQGFESGNPAQCNTFSNLP
ncbi:MAG: neutral zinc metallopeptidase [Desulfovibrio sp.]|nr:neutral zinc metallopeptidase [Desulfovibrio sp.]